MQTNFFKLNKIRSG